ncbi:MAG TPA: hypothetical protein DCY07_05820 [Rhodospirillaceae bacterium]|nr:hypothetical protein [Rhodospirillaceae bacterium]
MNHPNWQQVQNLIAKLYTVVDELEHIFPKRKFTPDGHLVGSIGEVIAAYMYDLDLLPPSAEGHDAKTKDGKLVQIKFTGGQSRFALSSEPDYLIALQLVDRKHIKEIYSGLGNIVWKSSNKLQKNGQRPITISKLAKIAQNISDENRIMCVREIKL